ncbi:MAG TPA: hypothetical protein VMT18_16040 [Planctomycetota bacterium]|nr:hypothetical protein [Planctomycetota bacterium]
MPTPLLVFTIDVEEDMPDWGITDPITVENVDALPRVHELCARQGVRPTYLCTYPVATMPSSVKVLRALHARGDCEIGTHMHAWNTPPFGAVPGRAGDERRHTYYQFELGPERFRAKLEVLHQALGELAGEAPRSFRAGRFGIDAATLLELLPLGYEVDSSVTPLTGPVAARGPDFRNAPQHPYRPARDDVTRPGELPIVEIPVSVSLTRRVPRLVRSTFLRLPQATHLRGLLSRDFLGWLDFAWLYPARFDLELMGAAARTLVEGGAPILNVFLHSSELVDGRSGRVRDGAELEQVYGRLDGLFRLCREEFGARPCTLLEAGRELADGLGLGAR